jgi:Type II site-specific deoxyribonuclease
MANRAKKLQQRIAALSAGQLALLDAIIDTFNQPITSKFNDSSDVVSQAFSDAFGDILKLHHTMSDDYLDKHRFEAPLERVFKALGRNASRPKRTNPGRDISVDGEAWSLKTQGDSNIKLDTLHISKFMELGRGRWESEADLPGLRDQFLKHMTAYDRVFQLRYFRLAPTAQRFSRHFYELVEIPKKLLREAARGEFAMRHQSRQHPKPGYCTVSAGGRVKFQLYFDGGTERKLQIKGLRKDLCIVHGSWEF